MSIFPYLTANFRTVKCPFWGFCFYLFGMVVIIDAANICCSVCICILQTTWPLKWCRCGFVLLLSSVKTVTFFKVCLQEYTASCKHINYYIQLSKSVTALADDFQSLFLHYSVLWLVQDTSAVLPSIAEGKVFKIQVATSERRFSNSSEILLLCSALWLHLFECNLYLVYDAFNAHDHIGMGFF